MTASLDPFANENAMKSAFIPRLINHPFGDPGLFVELRYEGRALLFDLGRIDKRPAASLFKVHHVFVSHTHMDHFIGFDHLLRLFLARERDLNLYGPAGFLDNVRGRLAGYTWNLIESYPLRLTVHEVGRDKIKTVALPARTAFTPENESERPFDGVLVDDEQFTVSTAHLDHRIPCLGFALEEKTRLNVRPERLAELGVPAGRWLNQLKQAVRDGLPPESPIVAEWREGGEMRSRSFQVGELRELLLVETEGQKIAYVVDTVFTRENMRRICDLVRDADTLFCESLFLDSERHEASKRYHLTARQAGTLARAAGVRRLENFHFSSRYERNPAPFRREAQAAFRGEIEPDVPD
jgi:ribonuclease Z